ncbi:hypothetical protein Q8W25_17760 [Shimia thalassica]|uniref:hypothetical protein n=1 Tax=Shimia thalassica TaxID=1715693 RepID=UPI002733B3E5|nr:hypothetical protein [Shimia thalassica]MDP2495879.1 hypothetical protein [Shimia thalassica]
MTRSHLTLVVSNDVPCSEIEPGRDQKSLAKVIDVYRLRVELPDRWSAYVVDRFGSYELAATFFGVTGQTAWNWFEGLNRPSADKMIMAQLSDPQGYHAAFIAPYLVDAAQLREVV